jgi:hypothetical protein
MSKRPIDSGGVFGRPHPSELSESLRNPQLVPSDHCYTVLQDHGPNEGGWGPAAIMLPGLLSQPTPFVYTGEDERALEVVKQACRVLAQRTGKPTRLVRYTQREDVFVVGGSS